jgi:hypothetical protein
VFQGSKRYSLAGAQQMDSVMCTMKAVRNDARTV